MMVEAMTAMVVMRKRGTNWKMLRSGWAAGSIISVTYSGGALVVVGSGGGAP